MNTLATKKLLGVAVTAALGLGMAGNAQAAFYTGTLQDWDDASPPGITDDDSDSVWSHLFNSDAIDGAVVTLEENEFIGVEWYSVHVDFTSLGGGGLGGGSFTLEYMGEKLDDELFSSVHLDIDHVGGGVEVFKWIYADAGFSDLLWQGSTTGAPVVGTYDGSQSIYVRETYTVTAGAGELHGSTNSFNVPEPASLLLLGAGLAGLGFTRRQRKLVVA